MDHDDLMRELPSLELMDRAARIRLQRERKYEQLRQHEIRERSLKSPPPRTPRLKFDLELMLKDATKHGNCFEVESLLQAGVNPNTQNFAGLTPIHECVIAGNEQLLRLLLRYKADINAQDVDLSTPLHLAAYGGDRELVSILIANGASLLAMDEDGNMPCHICEDKPTRSVILSAMAEQGITVEMVEEIREAPEKKMLEDMKSLRQRGKSLDARAPDGSTYLHVAAANGYYDVAAFLLRCNMKHSVRDNDLWTPMHAAAYWGQPDLIELLCDNGGDLDAVTRTSLTPIQLCVDDVTRSVINNLGQKEKRRRTTVRDSRRQSKKKRNIETAPQSAFVRNGRRHSFRDKSGPSLAQIEAKREHNDLLRSWGKEEDKDVEPGQSTNSSDKTKKPLDCQGKEVHGSQETRATKGGKCFGCFRTDADKKCCWSCTIS
ncbi:hypothetical protein QR680_007778 [Steinernema hermaphroditum]|uniref:Uncharacterized protein n=1 Tax=Steinernema hermaphroditum TaxID=289476 RepID=A0AA39M6H8_9BILA|nr:hypothetical protein QR680_007778 [Steinernema hermaphroditum]